MQSGCCNVEETTIQTIETTSSSTTTQTPEPPINSQNEFIDINSNFSRMAILKNQNYVATGRLNGVSIYDLRSKQLVRTLDYSPSWELKAFKQNLLIQPSWDETKIWNVETGQLVKILPGHSGDVLSMALNKDQTLMISGGRDGTVILWDMIDFKRIRTFTGHSDYVSCVAFNNAGNQVISGSGDHTIRVWSINDGSLVKTLTDHSSWVFRLLVDDQTGLLYSGSGDQTIKQWDIDSGRCLRTYPGNGNPVRNFIFSQDGQRIISSYESNSIIIWDKLSGRIIKQVNYSAWLHYLAINPLNGQLITTSEDRKMTFWNFKP